jgi:hypothetical protein
VINGPKFDMRTNVIKATAAFYSGLVSGHTYVLSVTPLDANGNPVGSTGHIDFVTTHVK